MSDWQEETKEIRKILLDYIDNHIKRTGKVPDVINVSRRFSTKIMMLPETTFSVSPNPDIGVKHTFMNIPLKIDPRIRGDIGLSIGDKLDILEKLNV